MHSNFTHTVAYHLQIHLAVFYIQAHTVTWSSIPHAKKVCNTGHTNSCRKMPQTNRHSSRAPTEQQTTCKDLQECGTHIATYSSVSHANRGEYAATCKSMPHTNTMQICTAPCKGACPKLGQKCPLFSQSHSPLMEVAGGGLFNRLWGRG